MSTVSYCIVRPSLVAARRSFHLHARKPQSVSFSVTTTTTTTSATRHNHSLSPRITTSSSVSSCRTTRSFSSSGGAAKGGGADGGDGKPRGGIAVPEMIKLGILCIPMVIYGLYAWRYGPSPEETQANVERLYAKELRESDKIVEYEKNIIRQAVYAPDKLNSTVDQLLQGGRYYNQVKDKRSLYESQLAEQWKEQQEAEEEAEAAAQAEEEEQEKKERRKRKKKAKAKQSDEEAQ